MLPRTFLLRRSARGWFGVRFEALFRTPADVAGSAGAAAAHPARTRPSALGCELRFRTASRSRWGSRPAVAQAVCVLACDAIAARLTWRQPMRRLLRRDGQGRARTEQRAAGAREQGGPWGRCALLFLVLGRMNSAHPGRCVLTFATAAGTGDLSLRFEHLRRRAAYPLEALRGLCALRLIAWDLAARVAREVARAIVLESALEGVDVQVPVRATARPC